jgi:nucleotidyltransferase substrate binding protein (TIGR01987 family)
MVFMSDLDIRWQQRFSNYQKALVQLKKFVKKKNLNELEEQGLIQAFEYTHELAWKTLADFIKSRGTKDVFGSKDATREAFSLGLIEKGEVWMEMINSRNLTSYTYNEETTHQIVQAIMENYCDAFKALEARLGSFLK